MKGQTTIQKVKGHQVKLQLKAYPESLQTQQDRQQTQHESQQTQHESQQLDHGRTKELLLALDLGDVLSGSDSDSELEVMTNWKQMLSWIFIPMPISRIVIFHISGLYDHAKW